MAGLSEDKPREGAKEEETLLHMNQRRAGKYTALTRRLKRREAALERCQRMARCRWLRPVVKVFAWMPFSV